ARHAGVRVCRPQANRVVQGLTAMLLLLGILSFGLAVFLIGEVATAPQRRRHLALKRAASYGVRRAQPASTLPRFGERVVAPAVERLAALALRLNPKASAEAIGSRLIAAGLSQRVSTSQFLPVKARLGAGGVCRCSAIG